MNTRTKKFRFRKHQIPARRERRPEQRGTTVLLPIMLAAVIFSLGLVYVNQSNSVATSGLTIKDLEQHATDLELKNQELELQAARLRSLTTVEKSIGDLSLSTRPATAYLPTLPSSVALGQ